VRVLGLGEEAEHLVGDLATAVAFPEQLSPPDVAEHPTAASGNDLEGGLAAA
jgi:hypothetical protein